MSITTVLAIMVICTLACNSAATLLSGRKLLDPIPPKVPNINSEDFFTSMNAYVEKVEQEKAKKPAAPSSGSTTDTGRRLLADPVAPQQPTVSDTDIYTKYSNFAAKIEQERAKKPAVQKQPTPPQQASRRHLLDVVAPKDPTVYDTTSHQFDVLQEFAQRIEQEKAQQPAPGGSSSP